MISEAVKSLTAYRQSIRRVRCKWCGYYGLQNEPFQFYDHDGGEKVNGFDKKQWLYIECPNCQYQWSLWKLQKCSPESLTR